MKNKKERIFNHYIYIDDDKTKLTREQFIKDTFITTDDKKIDYIQNLYVIY
jgi:hypothetical protein